MKNTQNESLSRGSKNSPIRARASGMYAGDDGRKVQHQVYLGTANKMAKMNR